MEKYLIAVDLKDFDTCLDEAKSLQKILRAKGINSTWSARHNLESVELNTPNGTIEFITFRTLTHESFTVGKQYDKVFYINPVCSQFNKRVKEPIYATDYLEWVLNKEQEKGSFKFENLKCANCKNLPICAIKDEYFDMQTAICDMLNTSKHFKKAELPCDYFVPKNPIFPCRCV